MRKEPLRHGLWLLVTLLCVVWTAGCGGANRADEAEKGTIVFGLTPWTTTIPSTYIVKNVFEELGYQTKLQSADVGIVYSGLNTGDIDVFLDAWLPDLHKDYMKQYGENIKDVSATYSDAVTGWVVPSYVDQSIRSIEDLKGRAKLFDGKIIGLEAGAGMMRTSEEMVDGYGLKKEYELVAGSEAAMLTEVKRRIARQEPILFLGYRPHTMFVDYDLRLLEDPKEYFRPSEIHALARKGFAEEVPEAYEFLQNWRISIEDVEEMIRLYEAGEDPETFAKEWIENNRDKVNQMMGR